MHERHIAFIKAIFQVGQFILYSYLELLLLFIVLPVANLTFKIFEIEEFTHGYRLKNIVRQLTLSFATAAVIIVEQHREALHQYVLKLTEGGERHL